MEETSVGGWHLVGGHRDHDVRSDGDVEQRRRMTSSCRWGWHRAGAPFSSSFKPLSPGKPSTSKKHRVILLLNIVVILMDVKRIITTKITIMNNIIMTFRLLACRSLGRLSHAVHLIASVWLWISNQVTWPNITTSVALYISQVFLIVLNPCHSAL